MRTTVPDRHRVANWMSEITLRLAGPADSAGLDRLARLDSRSPTVSPHLLAFRDGELAVALSLATGEVLADPFQRTLELQELLRCYTCGTYARAQRTPHTRRAAAAAPRLLDATT